MIELSIIIPTFKRGGIFYQCLASVIQSTQNISAEIIIINDSKDISINIPENISKNIITVYNNPKSGVASARNFGASMAKGNFLILIDDDMLVNTNAITKAYEFLNTSTSSTYNANWIYEDKLLLKISTTQFGRYLIKYNRTSLEGWNNGHLNWEKNSLLKANGITSQFFAIKKTDFEKVGGYNEKFPYAGFEDYDMSARLKENRIVNYIDTTTLIHHNDIDRLFPVNWLERKERGAKTRKVAVNMGYTELVINYNLLKGTAYFILTFLKKPITFSLKLIPNKKAFDFIYFKLINLLVGINIFQGYKNE